MGSESHIQKLGIPPKPGPSVPYFTDPLEHVVVHSSDPRIYLGSPSLARAPDGSLVISHDFFGPNSPEDAYGQWYRTQIFRSSNEADGVGEGAHWERIA